MLLKYFYDPVLAHASYMVGCQKTGQAIIVDPGRDIDQYLETAEREKMEIIGVAETHIHADYVSGARELADRIGAKLYVSDEGPAEWKYSYAKDYDHKLLKDGDTFGVGNVEFQVLHTPGHTPESISFMLTDRGGGADKPMGVFTGDFVFVGSIGRPDLLEEAAGLAGTAEAGARDLFRSIERFKQLPDYLQVWPAHGAGSACGKGLGAIPSSTVGYEKMFNPGLQFTDEEAFVKYILADQPEAPRYFALMKRINKEGPPLLGEHWLPKKLGTDLLCDTVARHLVLDTRNHKVFGKAFVEGTVNMETKYLAMWGGSMLNYDEPLYLISGSEQIAEDARILHKIGMDNIAGYFDASEVDAGDFNTEHIPQERPEQIIDRYRAGEVEIVDVRGKVERKEVRVPGARHVFLPRMMEEADQFADTDRVFVFQCRTGGRSMIAASLARRAKAKHVVNMDGGVVAWAEAGFPIESGEPQAANV